MFPQTWLIECLKMYKISDKIINFLAKAMKNWKVELSAGKQTLTNVKIQRGIFQGDSLSPPVFVLPIPVNYILRKWTEGYKFTKSAP